MKAAMLKALGQPLTIEDIAEPVPGAGEVLVHVLATPVLAYTREVFSGERKYPMMLPLVPGSGAIGLVEQTGPDATRLKPGQLVYCDPTVRSRDEHFSPVIMLQGWEARGEGPMKLHAYFHHGSFAEKDLQGLETPTTPFFSNLGTDGARKTDNVSIKKSREIAGNFSALSEGINNAGNSLENMIDQWEQIVMNAHLFPLVFDA